MENDCESITFMPFSSEPPNYITLHDDEAANGNDEVECVLIEEFHLESTTWKTINVTSIVEESDLDFEQGYKNIFTNEHLDDDKFDFAILIEGKGSFGAILLDEILEIKKITYVTNYLSQLDYGPGECPCFLDDDQETVIGIVHHENKDVEEIFYYINENWDYHSFEEWLVEDTVLRSLFEKAGIDPIKSEVRRIFKESIKLFDSTDANIEGNIERIF